MYELERVIVEVVSAVACFVLVKFMIKPYQLTKEGRYLGLPLGFGFLGVSYTIAAVAWAELVSFRDLMWLQLLSRTFSFVFIALTYYFSKKTSKNSRIPWNITLSLFAVVLIILVLVVIVPPQFTMPTYAGIQVYVRIFNIICLGYVAINTLRSHVKAPDPTTIWIPMGFILLAISQYSLLFYYSDASLAAFTGSLAIRLAALVVFLLVAYRTFYGSRTGDK
jgi:hypothetical protein